MFNCPKILIVTLSFIILKAFGRCQMDSEDMSLQNELNQDATHDLTDNDLKMVLSDLSLNDLKSLQQFIDSVDYNYLEYQENSAKLNSIKNKGFNNQEFEKFMDYPDQDDYSFEPQGNKNDLLYPRRSQRNFMQFLQESQRSKRSDLKRSINDEYIRQLDYSFPQNDQQNNGHDIELKKFHIRVKRN